MAWGPEWPGSKLSLTKPPCMTSGDLKNMTWTNEGDLTHAVEPEIALWCADGKRENGIYACPQYLQTVATRGDRQTLFKTNSSEVQDQASAMPETKEAAESQSATEQAELAEKEHAHEISNLYLPSGLIDDVGSHVSSVNEENTVGETKAEKRARLLRELQELAEEDEAVAKEELREAEEELTNEKRGVKELECQLKIGRKRVQECQAQVARKRARVPHLNQQKPPLYSPTTKKSSTSSRINDTTASTSQTAMALSVGSKDHAIPSKLIDSASPPKPHASSSRQVLERSLKELTEITYYTELSTQGSGKALPFNDMGLDQLHDLAAQEENDDDDGDEQHINTASNVSYFIFLKTNELEHLERAIQRAKRQIPMNADNPDYAPCLKDLIVMLFKKFEQTKSPDDLEEAIFRAMEMFVATPPDHPERPARMGDWIKLMFKKYSLTGMDEDLDEAMMTAREAGAVISVDSLDRGRILQIGIPIPREALTRDFNRAVQCDKTSTMDATIEPEEEEEVFPLLHKHLNESDKDLFRALDDTSWYPGQKGAIAVNSGKYGKQMLSLTPEKIEYLDKAISARRAILSLVVHGPATAAIFEVLAALYSGRYSISRSEDDLKQCIACGEEAIKYIKEGDSSSVATLFNLSVAFSCRYNNTDAEDDLEKAILFVSRSLSLQPKDNIRAAANCVLGELLLKCFYRTDNIEDLEGAVSQLRAAASLIPGDRPDCFNAVRDALLGSLSRLHKKSQDEGVDKSEELLESIKKIAERDPKAEDWMRKYHRNRNAGFLRSILEEPRGHGIELNKAIANNLGYNDKELFLPETHGDLLGPGNAVQITETPALVVFDKQMGTVAHVALSGPGRPDAMMMAMTTMLENHANEDDYEKNEPLELTKLDDKWTYQVDNSFTAKFFQELSEPTALLQSMTPAFMCESCSHANFLSPIIELSTSHYDDRYPSAKGCELCKRIYSVSNASKPVKILREGSNLRIEGQDKPIFRIHTSWDAKDIPSDIQIGYPINPQAGSSSHVELMRKWFQVCDESHDCCKEEQHASEDEKSDEDSAMENKLMDMHELSEYLESKKKKADRKEGQDDQKAQPPQESCLPTRVLDVGIDAASNSVYLYVSKIGERGRYMALSHRWGNVGDAIQDKYITRVCNYRKRRQEIKWTDLPKTFQDAVTVTRGLGIRYIWIDSICIIQPHKNCSSECGGLRDWRNEAGNMQRYYSQAYGTIAATSAGNSTTGFLERQIPTLYFNLTGTTSTGCPIYLSAIDDFDEDVNNAEINTRGWVLQERALSRRTIHFAGKQTYWECGEGIHCESLTRMSSPKSKFWGDPKFPQSIMGYLKLDRIRLFQYLFTAYSKLNLTVITDKPIAISGLLDRLAEDLNTKIPYGIIERFLHRSLLWCKSANGSLTRIEYPEHQQVPSWSWMAYNGEIDYEQIAYHRVEWSTSVRLVSAKDIGNERDDVENTENISDTILEGPARDFTAEAYDRARLNFDEEKKSAIKEITCVVLGKAKVEEAGDEYKYYILIIGLVEGTWKRYRRVGTGVVQGKDTVLKSAQEKVWII
ncbi:serine threonine kinase protein [Rutstroemia sp. NJR-2017a BVV2]|nr:serine threonine kinase protein [Rutstroemia sp. NJR-2017a BVV2]